MFHEFNESNDKYVYIPILPYELPTKPKTADDILNDLNEMIKEIDNRFNKQFTDTKDMK